MSQGPPLPPRPNTDTSEHMEFSALGKTPPVLLCDLIRYNPGEDCHQHEFYSSIEFDSETETVFLCLECHNWFFLTTMPDTDQEQKCMPEYYLHHLHATATRTSILANCCVCNLAVNIDIKEPFISLRLFDELSELRKFSYANAVKYSDFVYKTSFFHTIENMMEIISNLLDGDLQNLKFNCRDFEMDKVSQAIFEMLGFKLIDDCLNPPASISDNEKRNLKLAKDELLMGTFKLDGFKKFNAKTPYDKLNDVLGTTYKSHFGDSKFDAQSGIYIFQQSSSLLGCMPDMDDRTLIWAYNLGIQEVPEKTPQYLQAIYEMSKERKSESIEELVAVEKSKGKYHEDDIKDAYNCLSIGDDTVADDLVISAYEVLVSDHSSSRATYRDALYIIGKARNSAKILSVNEGPVNEMPDYYFSEMPVGLDNIGNTCYLNSLLQYYFTIRPLRSAVLNTNSSDANGYELDWQSTTIGHRKVSKSEIERAKKFVTLLRGLFVNLIQSSQRSISPDIDLAYLALVNIKDDDDDYKDASKSPIDDKMAIDSSPGPSSSRTTDYENTSYTVSEEITVEMEGTSYASHSLKGKEKENTGSSDFLNTSKEDKLKAASEMLLGRQQDVTECMDNVMFQLEAALKSLFTPDENGDEQNIIKRLFYGQTRQILDKRQNGELLTKEESFNHLIVAVAEGRDLYDGLDVYFDASLVDYDGTQAIREVTITDIPPILQIHVQRVQFDRSTSNVYKSNAFLRFDKVIYLDRYLDKNYDLLKQRRQEAHDWKQNIDKLQAELKDYDRDKTTMLSKVELLKLTADFIHDEMRNVMIDEESLAAMERESNRINVEMEEYRKSISKLKSQLSQQYQDLQEYEYRLHAVFIHSGQANFGHYWIYIFDFEKNRWLKFNDSYVTEVPDADVFADTTGSSTNPYCMVYVRAQDAKELVETVCRQNNC